MARYCVEIDSRASRCVLHRQHCTTYDHLRLLVLDRLSDIGDWPSLGDALSEAARDFGDVHTCGACCASTVQENASAEAETEAG